MKMRLILTAVAVLGLTAPANAAVATGSAQEAAQPAKSSDELALEAAAARFEARVDEMKVEMDALIAANPDNPDKVAAEAGAIITRYKPDFDAFGDTMGAFFDSQIAVAETDEARQELVNAKAYVVEMFTSLPDQMLRAIVASVAQPQ